jgi:hypothetical protein
MNPINLSLAAAGIILLGVGLVGVAGVVPYSVAGIGSIAPLTQGGTGLVVGFNWVTTGQVVTVTLNNTLPTTTGAAGSIAALVQTNTIGFGDGTFNTKGGVHQYAATGQYTLSETVVQKLGSATTQTSVSSVISVPSNATGKIANGKAGTANAFISPSFSVTQSGLTVNVTDTSVATNEIESAVNWTFGDSSTVTPSVIHGFVSHTYSNGGTYKVSQTVLGAPPGPGLTTPLYVTSQNVTVSQATSVAKTNTNPLFGASVPTGLSNPIALGFTIGGAILAVWQFVPVVMQRYGVGALVSFGVAGLAYALTGGPL